MRTGPLEEELRSLAAEGVQSLLLEGGPTLAQSFLDAGLVDKLLLFIAPVAEGEGPRFVDEAPPLVESSIRAVGEDLLLEGYLH